MPRVFITHEVALDYTKAETFGDLVPVTSRDVSNVPNSHANEALINQIDQNLRRFDFLQDFLLVSGSPYVSVLCAFVLGKKAVPGDKLRILRWSSQNEQYKPITLEMVS